MDKDAVLDKLSSCCDDINSVALHDKVLINSSLFAYLDLATRCLSSAMHDISFLPDYDD